MGGLLDDWIVGWMDEWIGDTTLGFVMDKILLLEGEPTAKPIPCERRGVGHDIDTLVVQDRGNTFL